MTDMPTPTDLEDFDEKFPNGRIEIFKNPAGGGHIARLRMPSVISPELFIMLRQTASQPVRIADSDILRSNTAGIITRLRMVEDEINVAKSIILRLLDELEKGDANGCAEPCCTSFRTNPV